MDRPNLIAPPSDPITTRRKPPAPRRHQTAAEGDFRHTVIRCKVGHGTDSVLSGRPLRRGPACLATTARAGRGAIHRRAGGTDTMPGALSLKTSQRKKLMHYYLSHRDLSVRSRAHIVLLLA